MTLKNSSIGIVRITPILRYRTAWLSRFVICTLIFSICILWVQNSAFAQEFNIKLDQGIYSTNAFLDKMKPDQAILSFTVEPNARLSDVSIVTVDGIRKNVVNPNLYVYSVGYGRFYVSGDKRYVISLIDPENFYISSPADTIGLFIIPQIQASLVNKNLGTVLERKNYISLLSPLIVVNPVDFRSYIQPWIVAGLVIAILIPAWYLIRRFLRG